jgi:hypothetical protein
MKTAKLAWLALGLTVASITANAEPDNRSDRDRPALSGDRASYTWRDLAGRRFNFTDGSQIRGDRMRGDWDLAPSRSAAAVATPKSSAVAAPEIDPASAASGLTLLFGGIAVLLAGRPRR